MSFKQMIHLEQNGFFTATWLVQDEMGRWGLWPDMTGNQEWDTDKLFVVWIGYGPVVREFMYQAMLVALTRITAEFRHLLIEPDDGCETAISVRYKDADPERKDGTRFIGLKVGTDTGKFATFWYTGQSFLVMHLAMIGGEELVSKWEDGRKTMYGEGVPGSSWCPWEEREIYDLSAPSWRKAPGEED